MAKKITDILYLFDRPTEPIYVPKGEKKVTFSIPPSYLPDKYSRAANDIFQTFALEATPTIIKVKEVKDMPDLSIPLECERDTSFSLFIPKHRDCAARLIEIFMGLEDFDDFLSIAIYCRERMNTHMFIYALAVAILHRSDTKHIGVPPLTEILPDKFFSGKIFGQIREMANVVKRFQSRTPIEIPKDYTASDLDEEHRVAYWREDIGINLHHWHWHLVYPIAGPENIVDKDRRGELFFYMHQQIMARYTCERFCNQLGRVKKMNNFRDPIPEGYFPKLNSTMASQTWPSRQSGATLQDVNRPQDNLEIDLLDLEIWRDRIFEIIHSGSVTDTKGVKTQLGEMSGIDDLGNIIEATSLSLNPKLYGNLHNSGHMAIAVCHDPDYRYLEEYTIMGENSTAMRDPIFYRWHAFINDIFMEFKNSLPEYPINMLNYEDVSISEVEVITPNGSKNELKTYWTKSDIDLSRGMDFMPRGPVCVRITHLNHSEFEYKIKANNATGYSKMGTVRIFMAPALDERGISFDFRSQKNLMIEMDKFSVKLSPGHNEIIRKSTESSVTIPYEQTFREISSDTPEEDITQQERFCGCGWPHHMLLPKGKKEGYPMILFAMISNNANDTVRGKSCSATKEPFSYCGLRDEKYPDARSMGYPFDRILPKNVTTLKQFLTPNMAIAPITIRFTDCKENRVEKSPISDEEKPKQDNELVVSFGKPFGFIDHGDKVSNSTGKKWNSNNHHNHHWNHHHHSKAMETLTTDNPNDAVTIHHSPSYHGDEKDSGKEDC